MKSIFGSAVIAASRPASATCEFHFVLISAGVSKMSGWFLMRVHEALAPLHRVRVGEVADEDQRMELLAGRLELRLGLDRHRLDGLARDRLVVGDDDDALGEVGRRAVEGRDRHVGFLRQRDQHRLRIAVVGGQDDAVGALRDAVLDLLELPIGILAAVQLDHLDAVLRSACRRSRHVRRPRSRSKDPGRRSRSSWLGGVGLAAADRKKCDRRRSGRECLKLPVHAVLPFRFFCALSDLCRSRAPSSSGPDRSFRRATISRKVIAQTGYQVIYVCAITLNANYQGKSGKCRSLDAITPGPTGTATTSAEIIRRCVSASSASTPDSRARNLAVFDFQLTDDQMDRTSPLTRRYSPPHRRTGLDTAVGPADAWSRRL